MDHPDARDDDLVGGKAVVWFEKDFKRARRTRMVHKTTTHGHFLQMGGFMLFRGQERMGTLSYERFKELLSKNRIKFPNITEEGIKDRSKSDGLSKAHVVSQIGWFVVQCIAPRIRNLPITELELVTLAFSALNGLMYFCWWSKPFDLEVPIPVQLLPKSDIEPGDEENSDQGET